MRFDIKVLHLDSAFTGMATMSNVSLVLFSHRNTKDTKR
jgi:hypothetical protein